MPNAQWGQTNQKIGVWSIERVIAGPSKENGWLVPQNPKLPDGLGGKVFIGKIGGEGCKVCYFLLIGWWWVNSAPGICAQPEVAILHLGGALVPTEELKDIVMCIPWGETRTLPQGCTVVSWLLLPCFCISPSSLATVWICPLELREGQGGWMKPISYNKKWGTQNSFCGQEGPTASCSVS